MFWKGLSDLRSGGMQGQQGCGPQPSTLFPGACTSLESRASPWGGAAGHQQGHSLDISVREQHRP